jgi:hypothetical protein
MLKSINLLAIIKIFKTYLSSAMDIVEAAKHTVWTDNNICANITESKCSLFKATIVQYLETGVLRGYHSTT